MGAQVITRVSISLGLFFLHFGCCTDPILNRTNEEQLANNAQLRKEMMKKKVNNGTGTQVKNFVNSLTKGSSNVTLRRRRPSRRIGKSLSQLQLNLLYNNLPKYLYSKEKLEEETREIVLEIGIGSGEHFIHQAKLKPEALLFGVEPYINGVASTLKLAELHNVTNILLFPDDFHYVFNDIPDGVLSNVYILFPDPWRKKVKRLINETFIDTMKSKLNDHGELVFATDIDEYFQEVTQWITKNNFQIINKDDYLKPPDNYIKTRYNEKAIAEGRRAKFLICRIVINT